MVRILQASVYLLVFASTSLQSKPGPGSVQLARFERVVRQARQQSALNEAALELLSKVAFGKAVDIRPDMEARFGFVRGELQGPNYSFTTVRVHAFRTIGKLGTPAAVAFLEQVTPDQFGQGEVHELWPAVQIALREALLNRISDRRGKIEFLEKILIQLRDPIADNKVDSWAVEELCNSGSVSSLPVVQRWINESFSTPTVRVEQVSFCEERTRVMMRNPDAIVAIASVLNVSSEPIDRRLTQWAVNQLTAMKTSRADEVLYRFETQISKLPDGSAQKEALRTYAVQIREIRILRSTWPTEETAGQ